MASALNLRNWQAQCSPALPIMIVLIAWYCSRPYLGIVNDALHYMALAFYRLDPATMSNDLLFLTGHQTYTIFPAIQSPLVHALGPGLSHLVLILLGQAIWLAGISWTATTLLGWRWTALAGIVSVLFFSRVYGPGGTLSYAETIATPRLFAEALTLLAIASALAKRRRSALVLACLATALHPLMAGPGLLVMSSMYFGFLKGYVIPFAAASFIGVCLAVGGIDPFASLFVQFDSTWKGILDEILPYRLTSSFTPLDAFFFVLPVTGLLLSISAPDRNIRSLARSILLVCSTLCIISLIGDVFENVLMSNLHLWRSLWILMVFGNLLAINALVNVLDTQFERLFFSAALGVAVFEPLLTRYPSVTAGFCILTLFARWVLPCLPPLPGFIAKAVMWILAGLLALLLGSIFFVRLFEALETDGMLELLHPLFLRALIVTSLILIVAAPSGRGYAFSVGLLVLSCLVLPDWDIRKPWRVSAEAGEGATPAVANLLQGRTVYWEGGPEIPWLVFRQASYYSCLQSAAIMSSRESAITFDLRGREISQLNTHDFPRKSLGYCHQRSDPDTDGPAHIDDVMKVCEAVKDLEIVALSTSLQDAQTLVWDAPVHRVISVESATADSVSKTKEFNEYEISRMYLYDCSILRGEDEVSGGVIDRPFRRKEG